MGFFKKGHILVLLINIVVACIILFVIGYIVLQRLDKYTNHGYYIAVPELRGLTPNETITPNRARSWNNSRRPTPA